MYNYVYATKTTCNEVQECHATLFFLFVSVMRIMLWLQLPRKPLPKKWWHVRDCYGFLHISRPFHMNITRFKSYLMAWIKKLCLYSPVSGTVSYLNRKNVMFHFFFLEKALFSSIADGHYVRSARKPSRSRISLPLWWKDGCLVHTLLLKYLHVMTAAHHSIQKSTATPSIFIFFLKDSLFGWHIKRWNCFCMSDRTVFYQQRECYVSVEVIHQLSSASSFLKKIANLAFSAYIAQASVVVAYSTTRRRQTTTSEKKPAGQ